MKKASENLPISVPPKVCRNPGSGVTFCCKRNHKKSALILEPINSLNYLHNFIFWILFHWWIRFRFSLRSFRWRWSFFILWENIENFKMKIWLPISFPLPFYVSHFEHFDCTESMTEAFERRYRIHVGFSCKDSSSNCDGADAMADVAVKLSGEQKVSKWSIKRYDSRLTEYQ